ncbi:putative reverse transcriptase domain-containing protein [Tanacetum coccineum]
MVFRAHSVAPNYKKEYLGSLPLCNKCKFRHIGRCAARCENCKWRGHQARDCRILGPKTKPRPSMAKLKAEVTCYECGELGHYKKDCLLVKFQNRVDKYWKGKARGDSNATTLIIYAFRKDHAMLRVVTLKLLLKKQFSGYIKFGLSSYDYWLGSPYTNHECSDWSTKPRESQTRGHRRYDQEGYTKRGVGDRVMLKVGFIAYKLKLPRELSRVHNTFHVSNLKKCHADEPLAVPLDGLHIDDKLQFVEEPVEITDREFKQLRQSRVPIVKVRWDSRRGPEFIGERKDQFKKKYPHLFTKTTPSTSAA